MIVDNFLRVKFDELTKRQAKELEHKLTFVKPSGDVVICYRKRVTAGEYLLPRGAWNFLPEDIRYVDRRSCPKMPRLWFALKLDDERDERFHGQSDAVETMLREEQGLVVRPPGTGKTQIALAFAARCMTRTLVLVHTEDILQQWVEYIQTAIPELASHVGIIRGKKCKIGQITVATTQTLYRSYVDEKPKSWWRQWGCIIADEAHHASAATWEAVLNTCPAKYRFGFTASPTRADGMHPTMRFIIGPVIHKQKFTSPVKLTVVPIKTKFDAPYRGHFDWGNLLRSLVVDEERNEKIAQIADKQIAAGNTVLVLSRRIDQLDGIAEAMSHPVEILAAERRTKAERKNVLADFRKGKIRCVLATQLADEALDVQRLNRVLLVHPGKAEGRIIQQIGRALRTHEEKRDAKIYDFVDYRVRPLRNQWRKRKQIYKANGIKVKRVGKLKIGGRDGN